VAQIQQAPQASAGLKKLASTVQAAQAAQVVPQITKVDPALLEKAQARLTTASRQAAEFVKQQPK
jgi:hypothetical protein